MILIESKRKKYDNILKKYPDAIIADVTSHAEDDLIKLSPFYPHGGIPVPFSEGVTATCVEAVWQGLKVFESADVDMKMFKNESMKNIKRTVITWRILSRMEDSILGRIVRNVVSISLSLEVEDLALHHGRSTSVMDWNIMSVLALP